MIAKLVLAVLAGAAAVAVATPFVTSGESLGHAYSHVVPAVIAALFALASSRLRRSPATRAGLLAFFLVVGAAQVVEAIGAWGFDEYGVLDRWPALTLVHDIALVGPFAAFAAGVAAAVAALVRSSDARKVTPTA